MNKKYLKTRIILLATMSILLQGFICSLHAQQYSNYDKNVDSLAVKEYNQVLPIWGKKALEKGFDLPEPIGISTNYMHLNQGLLLENILVGFDGVNNSIDPVNLDEFLEFEELSTVGSIVLVKPDVWLLPFMNVYGILGYVDLNTKVVLAQPIDLATDVRTSGYNYGFGTTVAGGIKDWWIAGNFTWSWTKLTNLDQPNYAVIASYRAGKAHDLGTNGKLTYWFGALHQRWGKTVSGAFQMSDILGDLPDATIPDKVRESDNYQNLTPQQRLVVDPMLDAIEEAGMGVRDNYDDMKLTYSVDKAPEHAWNMIVGANLALTRHWYLQTEVGFIKKTTVMAGVNYRFHL